MIDYRYLSSGVYALARAHLMKNSMAGHLGAAVVAGYFIGEQRPDLAPETVAGIEDDLERVMRGESVFGKKMAKSSPVSDAELFEPFPKEKPQENLIDAIAEALGEGIAKPRQSGHNVIFASIAIRALRAHPDLATPSIVDGIVRLTRLFRSTHPGSGLYGKGRGRLRGNQVEIPDTDTTPEYDDIPGMGRAVLDELINQDPAIHRQGYGGLVHINNHAAAIIELAQCGYPELIAPAVASHRVHLQLWRNLPDLADELGPMKVSAHTPHSPGYWKQETIPYDRALLTHRVKTMYGFDELVGQLDEDENREKQAYQNLRFLM